MRCLSIHSTYRCRHAGACCEATWHIPVERHVVALVEARGISRPGFSGAGFATAEGLPEPVVAREPDGACVFFDRPGGRLCSIHRQAGADALPAACRNFPRVVVHDDRGSFLTLSHFCPTAAVMLLDTGPLEIVEAAPPLHLEGLDGFEARGALPPLVRPGVLSDLAGYDAWERACIRELSDRGRPVAASVGVIARATEIVRGWTPGHASLADHVARAFLDARSAPAGRADSGADARLLGMLTDQSGARLIGAAPLAPEAEAAWTRIAASSRFDGPTANYLAARIVANRLAYEARGLRTMLAWIRTCLAAVRRALARRCVEPGVQVTPADFVEAVRAADFVLMHAADTRSFARSCEALEGDHRE